MPKISVTLNGNLREYRLDNGMSLTIGRRKGNDIVIQHPAVSKEHAKIESSEGRYLLTDLQSVNGIFVNGALVSSHWLTDGDVLEIGTYHLLFTCDEDEVQGEIKTNEVEEVLVSEDVPEKQPAKIASTDTRVSSRKMEPEAIGILSFLAGGRGEIKLTEESTKVGKDASCDIVLWGLLIGKIAFTIERRKNGYYLNYVGGVSTPKVSGQPVRRSMKLEESDIVEIGSTKLLFFMGK